MLLDYKFKPRDYQIPLLRAFDDGFKRLFWVIHRRGGKDLTIWNLVIAEAIAKKGLYYYFFPTYTQAKKVIWEGITNDGDSFLSFIPDSLIEAKSAVELKVTLTNGSIIRLIGSDSYDAIRGTNPVGVVFSEFAYQHPLAWEVVAPILRANGGWAIFNTTPNGKNFAYRLFETAKTLEHWWTEALDINATGVLTNKDIEQERAEGKLETLIQQEYFVSFEVGALGAYYATLIQKAKQEERICTLTYDKLKPVDVFFDIGRNDSTTIIFAQTQGEDIRIIDYYDNRGVEFSHYVEFLRLTGYAIRYVWLPHDGFHKRVEAKLSCAGQMTEAGFMVREVPNIPVQSGINIARKIFPRVKFDKDKCATLLDALENYHQEYDELRKDFKDNPKHDWSSHGSDCFRYMSIVMEGAALTPLTSYQSAHNEYVNSIKVGTPKTNLDVLHDQMDDYTREHIKYLQSLNVNRQ